MKLLMELFSKNSSTGEAELCQTGSLFPSFYRLVRRLAGTTRWQVRGNKIYATPHKTLIYIRQHDCSPTIIVKSTRNYQFNYLKSTL
jgi:hypothetical protein